MLGKHTLNTWSSTQPSVTLSSGEAEFYGVVKAAGAALGHQSLLRDLNRDLPARVWTDSSAALGICSRSGLGKLRHLETRTLWVQEKVRTKAFQLRKVRGDVNPADLFTKHLSSREKVHSLTELFGCVFRTGRAESAPQLRRKMEVPTHVEEDEGMDAMVVDEFEPNFTDMEPHDIAILPHDYDDAEMDRLFPVIGAADEYRILEYVHEPEEDYTTAALAAGSRTTSTPTTRTTISNTSTSTSTSGSTTSPRKLAGENPDFGRRSRGGAQPRGQKSGAHDGPGMKEGSPDFGRPRSAISCPSRS